VLTHVQLAELYKIPNKLIAVLSGRDPAEVSRFRRGRKGVSPVARKAIEGSIDDVMGLIMAIQPELAAVEPEFAEGIKIDLDNPEAIKALLVLRDRLHKSEEKSETVS
jgi:hypothetical protein